jgi:hypothetical protein
MLLLFDPWTWHHRCDHPPRSLIDCLPRFVGRCRGEAAVAWGPPSMTDAFTLSRHASATVGANLHAMVEYKPPLTMARNSTLGHPSAWRHCITPNVTSDVARQIAARTREHTPFVDAKAYSYGNVPLLVKESIRDRDKVSTLGYANPMRPEVKQLYRSARRYPNTYNRRVVTKKAPLSLMTGRLNNSEREFRGDKLGLFERTMESSLNFQALGRSSWRNDSSYIPGNMEVDLSAQTTVGSLNLSPRARVERIQDHGPKTYVPFNQVGHINGDASSGLSTRALGQGGEDPMKSSTAQPFASKLSENSRRFPQRLAVGAAASLVVTPSPAFLGNSIEPGKIFRLKLKVQNRAAMCTRLTCTVVLTNNLVVHVKSVPHTLPPGGSGWIVLEVAAPFENGNCDAVLSLTDRRNEVEEGLKVVLVGKTKCKGKPVDGDEERRDEDNSSVHVMGESPGLMLTQKIVKTKMKHMDPPRDPNSPFRRHL